MCVLILVISSLQYFHCYTFFLDGAGQDRNSLKTGSQSMGGGVTRSLERGYKAVKNRVQSLGLGKSLA